MVSGQGADPTSLTAASDLDRPLDDPELPVVEHLIELRRRLIYSLCALAAASAASYRWSGEILSWLARPAGGLVFSAPAEAFYMRLKIAGAAGLVLTLPFVLHQAWLFVAPALERRMRPLALRLIPLSYVLFLLGASMALFVVVPAALKFLLSYGSEDVRPLLTLGAYLGFVVQLTVAFGVVFQLPLVLAFLNKAGIVSRAWLSAKRPYLYLGAFLGAALLTPGPDVFSQLALALPAVALLELTLLFLRDA